MYDFQNILNVIQTVLETIFFLQRHKNRPAAEVMSLIKSFIILAVIRRSV